jgi:hypothetical protein
MSEANHSTVWLDGAKQVAVYIYVQFRGIFLVACIPQ